MSGRGMVLVTLALLAASGGAIGARQALTSHTLLGRVTTPAGRPLAGVTVELANPAAKDSMRTVVTSGDGRYRIEKVVPGTYVLTFTLAGYGTAIRDIEIGGGGPEFEYDVQLRPSVGGAPNAPGTAAPSRRVICGMTVITPPGNIDPKIQAPRVPAPEGRQVKPTIRAIQPTLCWEPANPTEPNR